LALDLGEQLGLEGNGGTGAAIGNHDPISLFQSLQHGYQVVRAINPSGR
jgi:hypothetical protein